MVAVVPSLEGQLLLKDPQSIIAYQWRKYCYTPKDTVTLLPDLIISLPYQLSKFGREPNTLVTNIQIDLQGVFSRIFGNERNVTVSVTQIPSGIDGYDVNVSIMYTTLAGELDQVGATVSVNKKGQLVIPEDTLPFGLLS